MNLCKVIITFKITLEERMQVYLPFVTRLCLYFEPLKDTCTKYRIEKRIVTFPKLLQALYLIALSQCFDCC